MSQHSQRSMDSNSDNCKVYISNINKSIEEEDIRRKFSEFGVIKSLILKKKENNVTYSFIEYEKSSEAKAAIAEMDKKTYFDRVLKVEYGKGGHRGLEHYHTNRYENRNEKGRSYGRDPTERSHKKDYSPKKRSYSYQSNDSYDDRYKRKSASRSPHDRYRPYKPYPEKYRDHRDRSRSYERTSRYERRDYRDDRYKDDDRYRKTYRDQYDHRYRDEDKYRSYRRDRSSDRRDYDKDRRKDYRDPKDVDRPKEERYYKDDRYPTDRYEKYSRDRANDYKGNDYKGDYKGDRGNDYKGERGNEYKVDRSTDYKDYRREPYERRKEYSSRDQPAERKESKDYLYQQQRPPYERRGSPNRDSKVQYQRPE